MGANHSNSNGNENENYNDTNNKTTSTNSKITPQQLNDNKNTYEQKFTYLLTILEKSQDINNYNTNLKNETIKINDELVNKTKKLEEALTSNDDYYLTQKKIYNEVNENVSNYGVINSILGYSLMFLFVILLLLLSIKTLGGKI